MGFKGDVISREYGNTVCQCYSCITPVTLIAVRLVHYCNRGKKLQGTLDRLNLILHKLVSQMLEILEAPCPRNKRFTFAFLISLHDVCSRVTNPIKSNQTTVHDGKKTTFWYFSSSS